MHRNARRAAAALTAALFAAAVRTADAAVLLDVRAAVAPGKPARVALTFDAGTPVYRIYGDGTTDVTLVLVRTARAANAAATIAGKDDLRAITLEAVGDSLDVTFHESVPAHLSIAAGPGQTLVATIAPAPALAAPQPIPAAPVQPALPPAPAAAPIEVVPLKYADVSEIVGLLVPGQQIAPNDVFTPQEQNFGSSGYGGSAFGSIGGFAGSLGGGIGAPAQTIAQGSAFAGSGASLGTQITANVGVDRRLNAIVLSGSPETVADLKAKIEKLDVPLPAVVLETQIVELTESAARDVGIDFTNAGGPLATAALTSKTGSGADGTLNLQAAIYAQVTKGEGRVIARPRIVALSGATAQILTGDALPIVTAIAVSGVNALSQQVQYVNVGVNLQISPRVASDGYVTSHVFSEVSSVTGFSQGYPTLSQREATTSATVHDGDAFVIGGLLQENDISTLSKVPGVGDLPLLGGLFRVRHGTHQKTNLYIIVVPKIIRRTATG